MVVTPPRDTGLHGQYGGTGVHVSLAQQIRSPLLCTASNRRGTQRAFGRTTFKWGAGMSSAHSSDALDAADGQDCELAGRMCSGDAEAFGELFDRYGSQALAVAVAIVADRALADDVVHDAFVAMWQSIDQFDADTDTLGLWVVAVTRKQAFERLPTSAMP